jgi:aspartyl-tRNA(Asn)/glutamyl-tRNA(Gln) amidotransferase subunit A
MADPVAMYLADACTLPVNMAGLPGMSVPCGLSAGLPVGLQLIGAPWSEVTLLRAARGYEGVTAGAAWRSVRPRDLELLRDPGIAAPAERAAATR